MAAEKHSYYIVDKYGMTLQSNGWLFSGDNKPKIYRQLKSAKFCAESMARVKHMTIRVMSEDGEEIYIVRGSEMAGKIMKPVYDVKIPERKHAGGHIQGEHLKLLDMFLARGNRTMMLTFETKKEARTRATCFRAHLRLLGIENAEACVRGNDVYVEKWPPKERPPEWVRKKRNRGRDKG